MTQPISFIEIGNTYNPWEVVEQMRDYANRQGKRFQASVALVPQTRQFGDIFKEKHQLEWLFHALAPTGYRFRTADKETPQFGFELIVTP
jgi:hypothetical protein